MTHLRENSGSRDPPTSHLISRVLVLRGSLDFVLFANAVIHNGCGISSVMKRQGLQGRCFQRAILELGEEVLDNSQSNSGCNRSKFSSSTCDEACERLLGRTASKSPLHACRCSLACSLEAVLLLRWRPPRCHCGDRRFQRAIVELGEEISDNNQSSCGCNRSKFNKQHV